MLCPTLPQGYDIDNFWTENGDKTALLFLEKADVHLIGRYRTHIVAKEIKDDVEIWLGRPKLSNDIKKLECRNVLLKDFPVFFQPVTNQHNAKYLINRYNPAEIIPFIDDDPELQKLFTCFGFNSNGTYYKYIVAEIRHTHFNNCRKITTSKFSHFKDNRLRIQLPDGSFWGITATDIHPMENGQDGIYLLEHGSSPCKTEKKFKIESQPGYFDYVEAIIENLSLDESSIKRSEWKILIKGILISYALRAYSIGLLPIFVIIGGNGYGKSTFLRKILAFFFSYDRAKLVPLPHDVRAFVAALHYAAIYGIDNLDIKPSNTFLDVIASLTTGAAYRTRTLYTTHSVSEIINDCLLAMTSANDPLSRKDIQQRALYVYLDQIKQTDKKGERQIQNNMENKLPLMWGSFCRDLQTTIANLEIMDKNKIEINTNYRMVDYMRITAASYGIEAGHIDYIIQLFNRYQRICHRKNLENNIEFEMIYTAYCKRILDFHTGMTVGQMRTLMIEEKIDLKQLEDRESLTTILKNNQDLHSAFIVECHDNENHRPKIWTIKLKAHKAKEIYREMLKDCLGRDKMFLMKGVNISQISDKMKTCVNYDIKLLEYLPLKEFLENEKRLNCSGFVIKSLDEEKYSITINDANSDPDNSSEYSCNNN